MIIYKCYVMIYNYNIKKIINQIYFIKFLFIYLPYVFFKLIEKNKMILKFNPLINLFNESNKIKKIFFISIEIILKFKL